MRTAFWISVLLTAACGGGAGPAAPITVTATSANAATRFDLRTGSGMRYTLSAPRDATVADDAPLTLEKIAQVDQVAVVVTDAYPSIPGSLSMCQAGEERFLRVISIAGGEAMETLRVKIASCRDNLELDSPDIEWLPESSTVRIRWLSGPSDGMPEVRTIQIGRDGQPTRG